MFKWLKVIPGLAAKSYTTTFMCNTSAHAQKKYAASVAR